MTAGPGAGRTPTLDGLRGIAVLAVVIEHAWPTVLPGGFAGVDVFFVLSGYLITRMLLGEVARSGTVDLVAFYARRVRRIIPAATISVLLVALLFTVVLGVGFGQTFRTEALAAALSVSNFLFASRSTDYFAADPSSSPFLHYWSLAVEEQFYLFWPTVLLVLIVVGRRLAARATKATDDPGAKARARLLHTWLPIAVVAGIAAVSFGLTLSSSQTNAFFLLPHRAWELLVGALLAWLQMTVSWTPRSGRRGMEWGLAVGGAAALAVTFLIHVERWPGIATTLPVLGTAALILGGTSMPGARWLSVAGLRFFGRISYALYLWHWPILAAASLLALPELRPPLVVTAGAVALAIGAAVVSTFALEEPIRFSGTRWLARFRAIAAAAALVAVTAGVIVISTRVPPKADPGTAADFRAQAARTPSDRERLIDDDCYTRLRGSELHACVYGAAAGPDGDPVEAVPEGMPVAVLFGDSHAMHWFPAVDAWARSSGFALVPLTKSGCVAVDADTATDAVFRDSCNAWRPAALDRIAELRPDLIVVASSSDVGIIVNGRAFRPRIDPESWIPEVERMLVRLQALGPVLYLGDIPRPDFEVPRCMAVHASNVGACARPLASAQPPAFVVAQETATRQAGVDFVDPSEWLCPGGTCTWLMDGRIAYVDDHHMTATTAAALEPLLAPYLSATAANAIPTSP